VEFRRGPRLVELVRGKAQQDHDDRAGLIRIRGGGSCWSTVGLCAAAWMHDYRCDGQAASAGHAQDGDVRQHAMTASGRAVLLLLQQARTGTPTARLVLLSALFVVVAAVRLHAQYVDDLDGSSWYLQPGICLLLLAPGAAAFAVGVTSEWSSWAPVGVIVFYVGIASLMTWARQLTTNPGGVEPAVTQRRHQLYQRLGALVLGALVSLAGLLLLPHSGIGAPLLLGGPGGTGHAGLRPGR
jgi:hypothetical protein